jgi:ribonuclease PH
MKRVDGRSVDELRELRLTINIFEYAAGSVLLELGKTKVLCAVTLSEGVPHFLRGKGNAWLTAEYALLPASTTTRSPRDSSVRRSGRSVEISRIIGRSLRSVVSLNGIGEYTITIDCDVLQADGGTRCASICAAQAALNLADQRWRDMGIFDRSIIKNQVAAVSVGVSADETLLDLTAFEDNNIDSDFNFVLTDKDEIVEIQGTAEMGTVSWPQFSHMSELARRGTQDIIEVVKNITYRIEP